MELNKLTIKQAAQKLKKGEITAQELTLACLKRIKKIDSQVKACLTVCEDKAIEAAKKADDRIKKGEKGDLLGIPYLAKDNIMTKGIRTTAASKILENYIAPFDASVIEKLNNAGAVLLGKTNLDEFAHGASTENSYFGPTHNPWDLDRVPGGSSGGSGAAVVADMCLFALGTDTGGSIRCPASFCGLTGLKPTYGRASRFGLLSMTSSTDVPGVLSKTVEDAALVLAAIAGPDKKDATTFKQKSSDYEEYLQMGLKGLKFGLPREYFADGIDQEVRELINQSIKKFKELGVEFVDVTLPYIQYSVPTYYVITPSEISSNLARFDGIRYGYSHEEAKDIYEVYAKSRGRGFGPEVKRRIMIGTYALSAGYYDAYYLRAQKARTKIKEGLDQALKEVDCLLTPTSPHIAFKLGEIISDPIKMYLEDIFVSGASLAGLPAMSIPVGFSESMPVGMQLIGRSFEEKMIFRIGHNYQLNTDYHLKKPKIA